jgi:hypothetical protein
MIALPLILEEQFKKIMHAIKRHNFGLKVEDNLSDYLGSKIVQKKDKVNI